jgi:mitochondrial fission protein ELM1
MAAFRVPAAQIRARTCWIVTDGRRGSVATAAGIAETLGLHAEHRRVAPRALWSTLPSWSFLDPLKALATSSGMLTPPWPDIAIASGRQTIPYLQALRRTSEGATFTVLLQNPRTRLDVADLIWCPAHDRLSGANVISTLTSPHVMRPDRLAEMRSRPVAEFEAVGRPLAAVLLGGPNRVFRYDAETIERLAQCLRNLATAGVSFLITPSRRTTAPIFRAVTAATRGAKRIVSTREGKNPYWTFLAHSDFAIVTGDSVNMVSEACATGRPVYVFEPDGGSEKFGRFHASLRVYGAAQPLTPWTRITESWTYPPLDSAPQIAGEIVRRFNATRTTRAHLACTLSAALQSGA